MIYQYFWRVGLVDIKPEGKVRVLRAGYEQIFFSDVKRIRIEKNYGGKLWRKMK